MKVFVTFPRDKRASSHPVHITIPTTLWKRPNFLAIRSIPRKASLNIETFHWIEMYISTYVNALSWTWPPKSKLGVTNTVFDKSGVSIKKWGQIYDSFYCHGFLLRRVYVYDITLSYTTAFLKFLKLVYWGAKKFVALS